jgi:hypothetical protein
VDDARRRERPANRWTAAHRALEDAVERPGVFHIDHTAIIIAS